jgi:UDP-N-acetylenolpyruvoylglucosamine reductase
LVIVNYGGATAHDVISLSSQIQKDVHSMFGIHLQFEVQTI